MGTGYIRCFYAKQWEVLITMCCLRKYCGKDGAIVFALNIATVVGMVLHWTKVVLFINTC